MKVSIITPTYNRAEFLPELISSVARQSFDDFEHIIVDDASTDDTEDVLSAVSQDRVRALYHDTNRGANAARNTGIDASNGEYICFLDSDDRLLEDCLQRCATALDRLRPSFGGVYPTAKLIRDGDLFGYDIASDVVTSEEIADSNPIGGFSGTMFRREVFETVGTLDPAFEASQDYEFFVRVLQSYDIKGIKEALVVQDYATEKRISRDVSKKRTGFEQLVSKHPDKLSRERRAQQNYSEAMYYGENGQLAAARSLFGKALRKNPTKLTGYVFLAASLAGHRPFVVCLESLRRLRKYQTQLRYWWEVEHNATTQPSREEERTDETGPTV